MADPSSTKTDESASVLPKPVSPEEVLPDPAIMEAMAEFAAGAGHEINNPLAAILGRVQLLLRDETDAGRRESLEVIGTQVLRIRDMIGDVMTFARPPEPHPVKVPLRETLPELVEQVRSTLKLPDDLIKLKIIGEPVIQADKTQFAVVISELIRNARHAVMDVADPSITIVVKADSSELATIAVTDNGCGFTEIERTHLFHPYFSGRQAGRGLGFGLSKCWRIVELHGGSIVALEGETTGTTLKIEWPSAASEPMTD